MMSVKYKICCIILIYMYVNEIMLIESGGLTALLRVALCAALLLYFINVMVSGDNQLWMSS